MGVMDILNIYFLFGAVLIKLYIQTVNSIYFYIMGWRAKLTEAQLDDANL